MAGVVVWEGPSRINGEPIVMIATGLGAERSGNPKTGTMVQTWYLHRDMSPLEAMKCNGDVAVCGGCRLKGNRMKGRLCYVNPLTPQSVYRAYKRGAYPMLEDPSVFAGTYVRLGAYGDPASVPADVAETLVSMAAGHTGYTHQWRNPALRDVTTWCMASVESSADVARAQSYGLGTFRVIAPGSPVPERVLHCPASKEQGNRITCAECGACNGSRRDVVIHAHGFAKGHAGKVLPVL